MNWWGTLAVLLQVVLLLLGLFMILIILLQRGRGGGLAGAFGGMGGQSAFGTKAGDVFTRITVVVAAIWVVLAGVSGLAMRKSTTAFGSGFGEDTSREKTEFTADPDATDIPESLPFPDLGSPADSSSSPPATDVPEAGSTTIPPNAEGNVPAGEGTTDSTGGSPAGTLPAPLLSPGNDSPPPADQTKPAENGAAPAAGEGTGEGNAEVPKSNAPPSEAPKSDAEP